MSLLVIAACGDDDSAAGGGGGGAASLSEEAFCAQLAEMEDDDVEFDGEVVAQLAALARQAPTAELRGALETFAEIAEQLEGLDDDDPEAIGIAFGVMFDPEVMGAIETIERFLSETCGIDTGDDWDFDQGVGGSTSDGSAWDDLDSGELRDAMADAFDRYASDRNGTGVGIVPRGGGVVVDVSVYDGTDVDALGLCESLAALVDARTSDPGVKLEVLVDDDVVAERPPGGTCTGL
jgi:hypothetical protein